MLTSQYRLSVKTHIGATLTYMNEIAINYTLHACTWCHNREGSLQQQPERRQELLLDTAKLHIALHVDPGCVNSAQDRKNVCTQMKICDPLREKGPFGIKYKFTVGSQEHTILIFYHFCSFITIWKFSLISSIWYATFVSCTKISM